MKKKVNTLLTMSVLAIILSLMIIPNTVYAIEKIDGDYTEEEGAEPIEMSEEEIAILEEKEAALDAYVESQSAVQPQATATWHYLSTTFPNNKQENGYYCGPATVQNVIQYHTGTKYSQSTLASKLGTTTSGTVMGNIDDVLRDYTGKNYVYADIESVSKWKRRVANNINDTKMAVVLDINSSNYSQWPYTTSGHFIPIYACYDATTTSCTQVKISDSHPNYNCRWTATVTNAYAVNEAHFNHAMIW